MTQELTRLIQNSRATFRTLSVEALYQLTLSLRDELERRSLDCRPEADALCLALLAHARSEHAAIFSADCSTRPCACAPRECCSLCTNHVVFPLAEES